MFLIIGLLGIGLAAYDYAARDLYQAYENREFDRALAARALGRDPAQSSAPTVASAPPQSPAKQHQAPAPRRELIGRIAIPRLGIAAMIKEGINYRTLGLAVGHIPSTALPGETGNVGLAAHRDNLFRNLKGVARDDEIVLTTLDNTFTYRVAALMV